MSDMGESYEACDEPCPGSTSDDGLMPCPRVKGHGGEHLWWLASITFAHTTALWIYGVKPSGKGVESVMHADMEGADPLCPVEVAAVIWMFMPETRTDF